MVAKGVAWALVVLISFSFSLPLASADRGTLPLTDVEVYGPGQKAIIAWNGAVERLILSTDLYASADTTVLEVLPLPSEPSVAEGSFESFEAIQSLMMKNMPRAEAPQERSGLEVIFHERVGAHDITIVKATSVEELTRFISEYAREMGLAQPIMVKKTRGILSDYIARGYNYWVFDLVDLYSAPKSINPVIYDFETASLYYPLKISATAEGDTEVTLYLITPERVDESAIPPRMRIAHYLPTEQPIQFQLYPEELGTIDNGIASLFPTPLIYPPPPAAWFTAVKFEGRLSDLDFDLEIPPKPAQCRSIEVTTDKDRYQLGETVSITVDFRHLAPGCFEIQVLHTHQIRVEVRSSDGRLLQSWRWETDDDLYEIVSWKPDQVDVYEVRASSWWDGKRKEVEDRAQISVSGSTSRPTPSPPPVTTSIPPPPGFEAQGILYCAIIAVVCVLIGVGVTYLLLRPRLK
ncbi:MAG: DUF2330 domain-containing protein [Candidatus Bathyarchaeia archaeon]